jgi:hypothetical protein
VDIDSFFARIDTQNAERPGAHTLHPGLTDAELANWQFQHAGERLPGDLAALLRRSNDLGTWQDWYDGEPIFDEGAYRFFPLEGIKPADEAMYGKPVDHPRVRKSWRAMCIGPDSSVFYGFDAETLHFWRFEPILPEESEELGLGIGPVLDEVMEG